MKAEFTVAISVLFGVGVLLVAIRLVFSSIQKKLGNHIQKRFDKEKIIRAVPFKEYVIPLKSITEVSLPNSFNGKSVFSKLLCIQYKTDSGSDAIA